MSGRWWRAYSRARHDPKLLKLSDKTFRWWFNIVCVASDNDGVLPSHADLAVEFRTSGAAMTKVLDELVSAGLLDHNETGIHPHNWNGLQYKSDVSNERVKRYRERHRNGECNVSETPSESEADTDKTKAKALGAKAPARDVIFAEGLPWLIRRTGKSRAAAASIIGKWCSDHGDDVVLGVMQLAEIENPVDPVAWIVARFKPKESWNDRRIREGMAVIMGGQQ
jgi:hypothetical protein